MSDASEVGRTAPSQSTGPNAARTAQQERTKETFGTLLERQRDAAGRRGAPHPCTGPARVRTLGNLVIRLSLAKLESVPTDLSSRGAERLQRPPEGSIRSTSDAEGRSDDHRSGGQSGDHSGGQSGGQSGGHSGDQAGDQAREQGADQAQGRARDRSDGSPIDRREEAGVHPQQDARGGMPEASTLRNTVPSGWAAGGRGTSEQEGPNHFAAPSAAGSMDAAWKFTEFNAAFNLQYLQLQERCQVEGRQFTLLSNVMKSNHDGVKQAINNIR